MPTHKLITFLSSLYYACKITFLYVLQSPASPHCKKTGQEPGNEASYNQPYFDIPLFPGCSERELYTRGEPGTFSHVIMT